MLDFEDEAEFATKPNSLVPNSLAAPVLKKGQETAILKLATSL